MGKKQSTKKRKKKKRKKKTTYKNNNETMKKKTKIHQQRSAQGSHYMYLNKMSRNCMLSLRDIGHSASHSLQLPTVKKLGLRLLIPLRAHK